MPRDPCDVLEEDRVRLTHMLESAHRAVRIVQGLTQTTLEADEVRVLAVVKSIEIIGEASTKVSAATTQRLTGIEWRNIRAMRNRMIHGYDTIDTAIVWRTMTEYLPPLIGELERCLAAWPPPAPPAD